MRKLLLLSPSLLTSRPAGVLARQPEKCMRLFSAQQSQLASQQRRAFLRNIQLKSPLWYNQYRAFVTLSKHMNLYSASGLHLSRPLATATEKRTSLTRRILRVLKTKSFGLPVGVGLLLIAYLQWKKLQEERSEIEPQIFPYWRVKLYRSYPLRLWSRLIGWVSEIYIPVPLRSAIIGSYARFFACDLTEAVKSEIDDYETVGQFFTRRIRPETRPVGKGDLVSPADGTVLTFGRVHDCEVEQVKGLTYKLTELLGDDLTVCQTDTPANPKKCLYQVVVYLSPAEYHGFHSPAQWDVTLLRHFTGHLLSVRRSIVERVPQVFSLNERVALLGTWPHGFFSMTAIGATHVGNIYLDFHPQLKTNLIRRLQRPQVFEDAVLANDLDRGDRVGGFRLGSTIVLIFEAPSTFKFTVVPGAKVKYGESLGVIK